MIISRTPLRISFLGGGSDLPSYYEQEPGAVLSTSINKYIYIDVNAKFDRAIRASYSVTEIVDSLHQLKHELIREALELVGIDSGIEITSISDIPSTGTGMGSSSTYTVGLLNALYAFAGKFAGAEKLAQEACWIEIEKCGKPIGKQDQYIAAYGGLQFIQFNPDGTVNVDPVICSPATKKALHCNLLLLYTGMTRSADNVLKQQNANTQDSTAVRDGLRRLTAMASELRSALCQANIDCLGEMLHESWMLKRTFAKEVSNDRIDAWYEVARNNGAIGGKILGAGGGGFLLLYAHPDSHRRIIDALPELTPVAFEFEPQGSKIIYVEN